MIKSSLIWRRHHCRWRVAYFDLCLTLMDIEQWGFLSVPHLLWHEASVYNGNLLEPVALTPIAKHQLSLPVFTTSVCRGWDSYNQPSTCQENALTDCATAAVNVGIEELFSLWQHYTTSPVHFSKSVVQYLRAENRINFRTKWTIVVSADCTS